MAVERSLRIAMVAISINKLTKKFGDKTAVSIPEFYFPANEIIGLVGNNGAGKTTLFRLILNLLKADIGSVDFQFEQLQDKSDSDKNSPTHPTQLISNIDTAWKGYITAYLDEAFLIDYLTAEEFFSFILRANNLQTIGLEEALSDYKEFLSSEIIDQTKYIRELSAGNKQKVGIIAAMLEHPQFLILDEPFNFLDPTSQNALKAILPKLGQREGTTVIVSSHNLQHTIDISTRIVLLEKGLIINDFKTVDTAAIRELEAYFAAQ